MILVHPLQVAIWAILNDQYYVLNSFEIFLKNKRNNLKIKFYQNPFAHPINGHLEFPGQWHAFPINCAILSNKYGFHTVKIEIKL